MKSRMSFGFVLDLFLAPAGLYFAIFGARLLFEKGYVEKLREGRWKPSTNNLLSGKDSYRYDKFVTGFRYLIVGVMFLAFTIWTFFLPMNS